jgi:type VI secretion system secreted protein Hcp
MASDYLLEIDGIKGESKDDFHKGSIQVESWSFGASNPGASQQGANHKDFVVSKHIDKASPLLMLSCCTGKHIPKAILHVRKSTADPTAYYTITLTDIVISSFDGGAEGGDVPADSFSLNFTKIKYDYVYRSSAPISTGDLTDIDDGSGTP